MPVTGRVALRPNRSLRAERAVSLACAALANRQIGFGRVRFALRPFPHRCVGFGGELRRTWHGRVRAFRGRPRLPPRSASGLGRPPHPPDAGHPALAEYRLRGLASPRRRGGASGRPRCARPRVRPRPVLRAGGTTFGLPYGASLALAPTLRRRSAALPRDGGIYPALCAGSPIGGASRPGEPQRLTRRVRPTFPLRSFSAKISCDCSCAEPWSGRAVRARGLARRAGAAGGGWRGGCAGGAARDDSIAPHPPRRRKPGVRRRNAHARR